MYLIGNRPNTLAMELGTPWRVLRERRVLLRVPRREEEHHCHEREEREPAQTIHHAAS